MEKQFDVVAVGMINFDVNILGCDAGILNHKVTDVERTTLSLGGDAQNCAFTLARLGLRTALCGAVGMDLAGDICLRQQQAAGIDTSLIRRKTEQTGIAVQLLQTSEASVLNCAGVNAQYNMEDIPDEFYGCAKVMSLNSFFGCGRLGAEFLRRAQAGGMLTVADTTTLVGDNRLEQIQDALPNVDYFVPSLAEARALTGLDEPDALAGRFLSLGVKSVVIKLGSLGCYLRTPLTAVMVRGYAMENVVDTTGCGDNFVAGFIAGLCRNLPLEECARYANAAGAINTQCLGSNGAVRSFEHLTEFLRQHQNH